MRNLVTIRFGSHLYGTSTPASDIDYKSVFVPTARDLVMQRAPQTITNKRPKAFGEKNVAGEVDEEGYSLQRFLALASEGQTVALDVLFSPAASMIYAPAREWCDIIENRHRLLTRKSKSFVGYVRTQSNKYGIKGSRVAAARAALALLSNAINTFGTTMKLESLLPVIEISVAQHEFSSLVDIENTGTGTVMRHWEVCGRKMPFSASLKVCHDIMKRMVDEYGKRALMAESQDGVDWKALSHAVRVGSQALELFKFNRITFPLPNAAHILDIKLGKLPYRQVADEIEDFLMKVEDAAAVSDLPEDPDFAWIEEFVHRVYGKEIARDMEVSI